MTEGIRRRGINNEDYQSSRGYVFIPPNLDRGKYIQTAFRKEKISIILEDGGGVVNDVYISRTAIQDIYFPVEVGDIGSCVACINIPPYNQYVVVGVISKEDESQLLGEDEFKREKKTATGVVSVCGRGRTGELFIDIDSTEAGTGGVFVNVKNRNRDAKLNINVFGETNIHTEGKATIESTEEINLSVIDNEAETVSSIIYKKGEGLSYSDEFGNSITANGGVVQIIPNEDGVFRVFEGDEPLLKGNTTVEQLEIEKSRVGDIISALRNSPVTAGDGGAGFKAAIIQALATTEAPDYSEVKSNKSFSD